MAKYKLSDLPPHVVAKIRPTDLSALEGREPVKALTPTAAPTAKRREPNKTELRYRREVIDRNPQINSCIYEGLTFRLSNGHRYTPDWIVVCGEWIMAIEVKGSYRFYSHGRARLAFDQARIEWPAIRFVWATWTGKEWKSEG